jgi:hypothetical protein
MKFFELQGLSSTTISCIFLLKISCGVFLWIIYTYYYTDKSTSDIFKFYDDAGHIYSALPKHPVHYLQMVFGINTNADYLKSYYSQMHHWYPPWRGAKFHDNKLIIQFNAFVYLFSFGYYNVHTVFMCFLSLVGLTGIYKTFVLIIPEKQKELVFVVFLIPSVLFWASGVLKEGIIVFALGMFIYYLFKWLYGSENKWRHFLFFVLCAGLLLLSKMYVFIAISPVVASLVFVKMTGNNHVFLKFVSVHVLFFIVAVNLYRVDTNFDILFYLHQRQMGFIHTAIAQKAGSYFEINYLEPNTWSLIKNMPHALFNTLFRSNVLESKSPFILISGLENLFMLAMLIITIVYSKKPDKNKLPMLFTCVFFVLMLSFLIGLVTPVLGSIVRYRVPAMPFYAIGLLLLIDKEKLISRFIFLRNKK